jgi:short-subunit dehydrogenase
MKSLQLNNKWILVTGASSGLGQEMAKQLAYNYKANLIIVARRADKLNELKAKLEAECGTLVKVMVADLSVAEDADRVIAESIADGNLYGAILNAGVTYFGKHTELPWANFENILNTNVIGVVRMTNSLVKYFEQPGKDGSLMLVSSMSAHYPVPYQAAYSATKAFITAFGSALHYELTNPAFSITVFAPGGIATEMTGGEKFNDLKGWLMPVSQAAKEGLHAFVNRKYNYVPGFLNRVGSVMMNFLPKKFITGRMSKVYLKSLTKAELE